MVSNRLKQKCFNLSSHNKPRREKERRRRNNVKQQVKEKEGHKPVLDTKLDNNSQTQNKPKGAI